MTKVVRVKSPGGVEQFEVAEVELPPPGADEVRIRQTAIGVNFVDIYQRAGLYPMPPANIPGVEGVGVVAAVGANVTSVGVGDRVAYAGAPVGAYAVERNLPAWRLVKLRDALSDEVVASSFVKGITAHMLLDRIYPVASGTTLLVHSAAGGVGQLLTRWASHRGAVVIGTVGSEAKAAIARQAGAQHVIVGRDADFAAAVADITAKRGVDVAYDGVGGTTLAKTFGCVRPFGVVASIGQAAGPIPPVDVSDLGPRRSLSLARPSVMAYMNEVAAYRSAAEAVLGGIEDGILHVSGQSYPFSEAARAHADLEAGRSSGALYLKP
ncbi:MAG TPA: quinone oxidoreductase [Bradyrhizobium sp.]|uniref:quinone oxidoreductase family protein n=1 Tax=Bradyrhizobium sp. TaxID=376 RepID=UPI002D7E321D|nr:quinone oxidoreductase [Bradyrhizobium sp.]HET7889819.1 quinone oxidoreductase [Bradyrhizobium sp.]